MKKMGILLLIVSSVLPAVPACSQVKLTKDQILFYTTDWKGDRFPDGRPKLPDSLLDRAKDMTIEDVWGFLRQKGYQNQFEGDWKALHMDKTIVGRAMTAQYMPLRPDVQKAIMAQGKKDGYVAPGNNSWPIAELKDGDVYVADGFGKIEYGTLIGSNLGNGIAWHTKAGFIFNAGIRDQEELREIPNFNGMYKGYDPTAWAQMGLTCINCEIRIGHAVVLPGDLVIGRPEDGILFVPAILAEAAISSAEFTALTDDFNFELNREGKNGGMFEGGWDSAKYDAFAKWIDQHPERLKMPKDEFNDLLKEARDRAARGGGGGM
jgi:4-hydroxy-4-methyl-2-oxoglutarate aldolase